jgi:cytochrome P460
MRHYVRWSVIGAASVFTVSLTLSAQGKSAAKADALAISDFKGYESWQLIAPSETDESLKGIVGNPAMMAAYRAGIPANGKAVPDGAMMAKIEWARQSNDASPYPVRVPGPLKSVAFMVKDAKRFGDSGGWGYAKFDRDAASGRLTQAGTGTGCGFACHTRVKASDYVFTKYGGR